MANTTNLDLVKPLGTDHALVSVINGNMDKIDAFAGGVNSTDESMQSGIAIVSDGDTHAAIAAGQYVYIKNHNTLNEGMYTANSAIAANVALSSSNVTAVSSGGLNALNSKITKLTTPTPSVASDLNNISETGMTTTDGSTSHSPGAWFVVYTMVATSTSAVQFALRTTSPAFYVRSKSGGTWSEWKYATLT